MRCAVLLAFLTFVAGCKNNEKSAAPAPAEAARPAATPPAAAPPAAITRERAQALLDQWLAAQNRGDFAAYQALYADRFEGVKRVGERVRRFARAGWMADRKRMFAKPMEVEAREAAIATTATTAEVRFVQRWRSGTFEDLGPKRLLLVLDGGALEIAREEMLRSEVVAAASPDEKPTGFGFLLSLDGKTFMVLEGAPVPDKRGKPKLEERDDGVYVASATATDADLGPDVTRWKGAPIRTDDGCETQVVGFRLVAREVPHFSTAQMWEGKIDSDGNMAEGDAPTTPVDDAEIADDIFTSGHVFVAAELAACRGLHAQMLLADRPASVDGEKVSDPALEKKARALFARLPEVTQLQREHKAQGGKGTWWEDSASVAIFKHPGSGQVVVAVGADNRGSCGEFSASAWIVYEVKSGALSTLYTGSPPAEILGAVDTDGDGRLELMVHGNFGTDAALLDGEGNEVAGLRHAFNDCAC
jgi:hypothetical protein